MTMPRFHLAFPVDDLTRARAFYGGLLGCTEGRSSESWVDFDFHGHQIVAHLAPEEAGGAATNAVDGDNVPVRHFGLILAWDQWEALSDRLKQEMCIRDRDNRDAWFIGYTADIVAGVWVGNDDGASMVKVTGGKLPTQIWANFMTAAHTGKPIRNLPGNWQPPVTIAAVPAQPEYDRTAPAYDPRFGPPGYTPEGYQRRTPRDPDAGFFARLFGGGDDEYGDGSNRGWAD